jgi:hypothetical protein
MKRQSWIVTGLALLFMNTKIIVVFLSDNYNKFHCVSRWFGMLCLCLDDSSQKLEVETFSQALALPNDVLKKLEELTPSTYSLRWSGLSVSLADVLQSNWTNFLAGEVEYYVDVLIIRLFYGLRV